MGFGGNKSVFGGGFGGGNSTPVVQLNLTALMDILSNLLFFLLAAYAAQATEVEVKSEMVLPSSASQTRLQLQLTVSITQKAVQVADVPVAKIEKGNLVGELDEEGNIPGLFAKLNEIRERRAEAGRPETPEAAGILLLADKDTDADAVSKVLKTAGQAGFVNVRFGVIAQ
jgi:biopolymer transport protein ExbD